MLLLMSTTQSSNLTGATSTIRRVTEMWIKHILCGCISVSWLHRGFIYWAFNERKHNQSIYFVRVYISGMWLRMYVLLCLNQLVICVEWWARVANRRRKCPLVEEMSPVYITIVYGLIVNPGMGTHWLRQTCWSTWADKLFCVCTRHTHPSVSGGM